MYLTTTEKYYSLTKTTDMVALIDGDSIPFILGWHHREHQNVSEMHSAIDKFLDDIFILTGADMYYGALADISGRPSFRAEVYKVKLYKGNRAELQPHMEFWRPVITHYLEDKWNFDRWVNPDHKVLEADDLVFGAHMQLQKQGIENIICSPDKDLRQIPGMHFDYRKSEDQFCMVDEYQALYNFYYLMIAGDDTDNIAGIPGKGDKYAREKLGPLLEARADRTSYEELVKPMYYKHFGEYYGDIIYAETKSTVSLLADLSRTVQVYSVPNKTHPFEVVNGD